MKGKPPGGRKMPCCRIALGKIIGESICGAGCLGYCERGSAAKRKGEATSGRGGGGRGSQAIAKSCN